MATTTMSDVGDYCCDRCADADDQEREQLRGRCPVCAGPLESVAGDYRTGVSMNGYHETVYDEGYWCERCKRVFATEDVE